MAMWILNVKREFRAIVWGNVPAAAMYIGKYTSWLTFMQHVVVVRHHRSDARMQTFAHPDVLWLAGHGGKLVGCKG
jgi:hypothetical protein